MILLAAVGCGLLAGLALAHWHGDPYQAPKLRNTWLVVAGFFPQLLIAYLPGTHELLPDWMAAAGLLGSLAIFLAFVWLNRRQPGMPLLLAGLVLNLTVMAANGGWMPISPQTASRVLRGDIAHHIVLGSRFGQKDIVLSSQQMRLGLLSDRFLLPAWSPYQVAFSAGDILIAAGVFWLLTRPASKPTPQSGVTNDHITRIHHQSTPQDGSWRASQRAQRAVRGRGREPELP